MKLFNKIFGLFKLYFYKHKNKSINNNNNDNDNDEINNLSTHNTNKDILHENCKNIILKLLILLINQVN